MLDRKLEEERVKYGRLEAPDHMEATLGQALDQARPRRYRFQKLASFLIIGALILGINSNSLGTYIRDRQDDPSRLDKYSDLMAENTKNLGGQGLVDSRPRRLVLDGREILVDGIIVDRQGFNLFVEGDKGAYSGLSILDEGGRSRPFTSGRGLDLDDEDRERWVYYFKGELEDTSLSLEFINDKNIYGVLDLDLDRDLTLDRLEEFKINKRIQDGEVNYRFTRLSISPMNIVLEGYNENIVELGLRTIFKRRKDYRDLDIDLIINGERVVQSQASRRTDLGGVSFYYIYDDFPDEVETLEIEAVLREGEEILELVEKIKVK